MVWGAAVLVLMITLVGHFVYAVDDHRGIIGGLLDGQTADRERLCHGGRWPRRAVDRLSGNRIGLETLTGVVSVCRCAEFNDCITIACYWR